MLARTWPYGTRKSVVVHEAHPRFIVCFEESADEAFILIGHHDEVKANDKGYIEFKQGGPQGAFWEYHPGSPILVT